MTLLKLPPENPNDDVRLSDRAFVLNERASNTCSSLS